MKPTPALGDTRRVVVMTRDAEAAVLRWESKGWKLTRRRSVNNVEIPAVTLTLSYVGPRAAR